MEDLTDATYRYLKWGKREEPDGEHRAVPVASPVGAEDRKGQ